METFMLCVTIFLARILDVSLGTLRTIIVVKEKKYLAALIAFFEVTIWFLVARTALAGEINWLVMVSYAAGFATGTLIGSILAQRFIDGKLTVQIITSNNNDELIEEIKTCGFGVSVLETKDKKLFLILEINKRKFTELKKLVYKIDPNAFIFAGETKYVINGFFK